MRVAKPAAAGTPESSSTERGALAAYACKTSTSQRLSSRVTSRNARAAAVAKRAEDDDKVRTRSWSCASIGEIPSSLPRGRSDRRHPGEEEVARLRFVAAAVAFDDQRPRTSVRRERLCGASPSVGLVRCRDAAEDADYASLLENRDPYQPPRPRRKRSFRRKKKVPPPPVEIPKLGGKPLMKAPPSRRKPRRPGAKDAEEADLLAQPSAPS